MSADYIIATEAHKILGLSKPGFYARIRQGTVPVAKTQKGKSKYLFRRAEIEALRRKGEPEPCATCGTVPKRQDRQSAGMHLSCIEEVRRQIDRKMPMAFVILLREGL